MFWYGKEKPLLRIAAMTRLRDSRTAMSGKTHDVKLPVGSRCEIHFDIDKMSFDAIDRDTPSFKKHGISGWWDNQRVTQSSGRAFSQQELIR
jgi:hypothetical protein